MSAPELAEESLRERVARAIHKADGHAWACGWPGCPSEALIHRFADAAIAVMSEETQP
jgi:hypothetical protein